MVTVEKIPFFVVWFEKNFQFMVRFDHFWGHFASGSGEMAPWNFLGAFRQSHWRNASKPNRTESDRTEPDRTERFGQLPIRFGLILVFKNI